MRRFVTLAACFGLLAIGPIADSRAAGVPLPENGTIVLPGHGWGHGRGMGQWGAKGMADAGATWTTIVNHYYSGITIGSRTPETIRVLVETSVDTIVTSDAPFNIAWSTGTPIATSDATYKFWRVSFGSANYVVQKSTAWNGPWVSVQKSAQSVVFTPQTQMLQLVYGTVVRYYRGTISSKYVSGTGIRSINELPLEQYLYGSVPRESPASWPAEELKAQAVAARSYAIYKKLNARAAGQMYDICTSTACQSYLGYASKPSVTGTKTVLESASSNAAVNATAGKVLLYGGKPICAEYSSSTGGFTAPGTVGYEKAVQDPTDSIGPLHDWTGKVAVSAIEAHWPSIGRLIDLTVTQRNGYGDWGGRVLQMNLVGTTGTVSVTGSGFQSAFPSSVRSNWFTPLYWAGQVVSVPASLTAIQGSPLTVSVLIKNTGTAAWPVGGSVRTYTPSASAFYMRSWISTVRVGSVARNVTTPSSSSVAPGQTAEFRLPLSTNLAPGDHAQSFGLVADGSSFMATRFPITVRILKAWVDEAPNMLTNASFDSVAGWSGSGRTTGDGVTTAFAREGTHSYALTGAGTKNINQTKTFAGGRSRAFTVGGWNRSDATSTSGGPISIDAVARYVDGTSQTWSMPLPLGPHAWTYAETTFVTSATKDLSSVTVFGRIASQTGTSYFDALRLLENPVSNFSFERGLTGWTASGLASGDGATLADKRDGAQSLSIAGGSSTKAVWQSFHYRAAAGEKLLFSAWSETAETSTSGGPLSIVLGLHHPSGVTTESTLPISAAAHAWSRGQIEIVATAPVDSVFVKVVVTGQTGTLNVDDVELVRDWGVNPSFEGSLSSWSTYNFTTGDGLVSSPVRDGSGALAITAGGHKGALEYLVRPGAAGAHFVVSGWSKTTGTSTTGGPVDIFVRFLNTDGTITYRSLVFATAAHDWTYQEGVVSAAKPFSKVLVYTISYDQTGSAWFDAVRLRSL